MVPYHVLRYNRICLAQQGLQSTEKVDKFNENLETMNDNPWFEYKFLIDNGWSYKNGKYIKNKY